MALYFAVVAGGFLRPSLRAAARCCVLVALASTIGTASAELPRVPVPPENPVTEPKRLLGKILFWDEQLSSDNTVACGSCHRPAHGGSDPRAARHPGTDPGTIDDVIGSPGIVSLDADGRRTAHPVFGERPQVTRRASPSNFGALWDAELFWDGRAGGEFRDPLTGEVAIAEGGALEAQALETLLNDAEMARSGRQWPDLTEKLAQTDPLALASDLPDDVADALAARGSYPELFAAAFGDAEITPVRIAFALAAYQRTLVADRTPWDRYRAGDETALSQAARLGWEALRAQRCTNCHTPPLFTNGRFLYIGLRRSEYDQGRRNVTGDAEDAGRMKVPSLRNAALKPRFMHTGQFGSLAAAIDSYEIGRLASAALPDRDDIPGAGAYNFSMGPLIAEDIRAFLTEALTDPRVRDEVFPFDRPKLRIEDAPVPWTAPSSPEAVRAERLYDRGAAIDWLPPADGSLVADYVLERDGRVIAVTTRTRYLDRSVTSGIHEYTVMARNAATDRSAPVHLQLEAARLNDRSRVGSGG